MATRGIDEDGNLDEGTLRRFVFQTYGRARRTQDSPIMPDVWLRYIRIAEAIANFNIARDARPDSEDAPPDDTVDLLLTMSSGERPGRIVKKLQDDLGSTKGVPIKDYRFAQRQPARIALSDRRIVARANFNTLACYIVPLSGWWMELIKDDSHFNNTFDDLTVHAEKPRGKYAELGRYVALVGFVDYLMRASSRETIRELGALADRLGAVNGGPAQQPIPILREIYQHARSLLWHAVPTPAEREEFSKGISLISLNRPAQQTLFESRATVKADAAHRVFEINTSGIAFAVIDGGIDATHPAFLDRLKKEVAELGPTPLPADCLKYSRVTETYDFTLLREIIDYAISEVEPKEEEDPNEAKAHLLPVPEGKEGYSIAALSRRHPRAFRHLAIRNKFARDLDWEIVRPLIRVSHADDRHYLPPETDHGTHVAGILAASWPKQKEKGVEQDLFGMCPHLTLYDLRVFDADGHGDEFAILCALEFVGWLNRDRAVPVVHGVNLSLALAHDVDSFACGQTPVCEACNHLVGNGTVVVAAAGNTGFENGASVEKQSMGTGYRQISITDPGNADHVITVGSTHQRDPHVYGVSYFSARGPTGDGRRKPDILAPGEKITSTIPGPDLQRMDGTSMAAPHVAGAAAMLMARYPELIGRPARIKEILMSTATDLKREAHFQGAGLVDVLRALQSV